MNQEYYSPFADFRLANYVGIESLRGRDRMRLRGHSGEDFRIRSFTSIEGRHISDDSLRYDSPTCRLPKEKEWNPAQEKYTPTMCCEER